MTDTDEQWDPADVVAELDAEGSLEFDGDIDAIIEMHESLNSGGFDADSPETYRVMVATAMYIAGTACDEDDEDADGWGIGFESACEVIARIAARCFRDLRANGG